MTKRTHSTEPAVSTSDALAMLRAGVDALESSAAWLAYLNVAGRFHDYSFGNQLLIALQQPGATRVAGFHTWLNLGRHVRKAEKGIRILAPCVYRKQDQAEGDDDPEQAEVVRSFRVVSVFDVSQTDGDELPELPCQRLSGDAGEQVYARLLAFAHGEGLTVETSAGQDDGPNGWYNASQRRVWVRQDMAMSQRAKTLAHELGHHLSRALVLDRPSAEVLAESVAYLSMRAAGIDSGDYSFAYLASWTRDRKQRQTIMETAAKVADDLIAGILPSLLAAAA